MKTNIREYGERRVVEVEKDDGRYVAEATNRWIIRAANEGGHNCTEVDLQDVIDWVKANMPELLK